MLEDKHYENDKARITITFANNTKEEQDRAFKNIAEACYKLCKYEYQRGLEKTNEDSNLDS